MGYDWEKTYNTLDELLYDMDKDNWHVARSKMAKAVQTEIAKETKEAKHENCD